MAWLLGIGALLRVAVGVVFAVSDLICLVNSLCSSPTTSILFPLKVS